MGAIKHSAEFGYDFGEFHGEDGARADCFEYPDSNKFIFREFNITRDFVHMMLEMSKQAGREAGSMYQNDMPKNILQAAKSLMFHLDLKTEILLGHIRREYCGKTDSPVFTRRWNN